MLRFICPVVAAHVFDSFGVISYGGHNFVSMGNGGFCDYFVAKLGGVGEPFTVGFLDVAYVCSLVLWGCGQITSVY